MTSKAPLWTSSFAVTVEAAHVALFSRALGGQAGAIPATYPIAWLGQPVIKAALASSVMQIAGPKGGLIHLAQRFEHIRPLALGASYEMTVRLEAGKAPRSLLIEAHYADASGPVGALVAEFLVLVPGAEP